MTYPIERISWIDTHDLGSGEWIDTPTDVECTNVSAGFVVAETDLFVVITHSVSSAGHLRSAFAIPKSAIVERVRVRVD